MRGKESETNHKKGDLEKQLEVLRTEQKKTLDDGIMCEAHM